MPLQQRGASVLAAARAYGIPHHRMRAIIREGYVVPRAVGRRSIVIFSELESYLRSLPATKSSRPRSSLGEAVHA